MILHRDMFQRYKAQPRRLIDYGHFDRMGCLMPLAALRLHLQKMCEPRECFLVRSSDVLARTSDVSDLVPLLAGDAFFAAWQDLLDAVLGVHVQRGLLLSDQCWSGASAHEQEVKGSVEFVSGLLHMLEFLAQSDVWWQVDADAARMAFLSDYLHFDLDARVDAGGLLPDVAQACVQRLPRLYLDGLRCLNKALLAHISRRNARQAGCVECIWLSLVGAHNQADREVVRKRLRAHIKRSDLVGWLADGRLLVLSPMPGNATGVVRERLRALAPDLGIRVESAGSMGLSDAAEVMCG